MIFNFYDLMPSLFFFTSTRMILAAMTSLLLSIFLGPWFIKKLKQLKMGQPIIEECPSLGELHQKKQDTPTMGGVLIIFAMLISLFLWMDLHSSYTLLLLITTLVLAIVGGRDDYLKMKYKKNNKGLTGKKKLLFQGILAAFIASYLLVPAVSQAIHQNEWFSLPVIKEEITSAGPAKILSLQEYGGRIYLPFMKEPLLQFSGYWLVIPFLFIMFVIVGASNAVNLTDGLDGLASGVLILVAGTLAIFAFVANNYDLASYLNILYVEGASEIAVYLSAVAGACLGFLWYNCNPAEVFMGDTGSLTLGGIIGVAAVLLGREVLLGLIGGIFVAEALSVIMQVISFKYFNKHRIFLCAPLHHHFELKGWKEMKVVVRFWIVGLLLALIGLGSLKFQ